MTQPTQNSVTAAAQYTRRIQETAQKDAAMVQASHSLHDWLKQDAAGTGTASGEVEWLTQLRQEACQLHAMRAHDGTDP